MGWLDRLFWSPDNDDDKDVDTHRCDFEIVERGEYTQFQRWATNDGFEAHFAQKVVMECTECGEQLDGIDYDEVIKRTIEWDEEVSVDEDEHNGIHVKNEYYTTTVYQDVEDKTQE
jgi:hypothetical protein